MELNISQEIVDVVATNRGWVPPETDIGQTSQQFVTALLYSFIQEEYVGAKATSASEQARTGAITQAQIDTQSITDAITQLTPLITPPINPPPQ